MKSSVLFLLFDCKHGKEFRILEDYYRDIICEICNVAVFPWFIEQTFKRTNVPNRNYKVMSVLYFIVQCFNMLILCFGYL